MKNKKDIYIWSHYQWQSCFTMIEKFWVQISDRMNQIITSYEIQIDQMSLPYVLENSENFNYFLDFIQLFQNKKFMEDGAIQAKML